MSQQTVTLHNEQLTLLPEAAILWADHTLIVADVHLGKAATFRRAGIPVPSGGTQADLSRLSQLIEQTAVQRLILLGDLLHAKTGRTSDLITNVTRWRARHANLNLYLVRGNHDRYAGDPPVEWNMTSVDEPFVEPPFALRHYPTPSTEGYTLAGHLHPAIRLRGLGRQQDKLPCFHFTPKVGTLPAFGSFTGTAVIKPSSADQVYVIADDEVLRVRQHLNPS